MKANRKSYLVTPKSEEPKSVQLIDLPVDAITESKRIMRTTMDTAVIKELTIDSYDEIINVQEVNLKVVSIPLTPTIKPIQKFERFRVEGLDTIHQFMYMENKRFICSEVQGKLTEAEEQKVTQTLSSGDYLQNEDQLFTFIVIPSNSIHKAQTQFIKIHQ